MVVGGSSEVLGHALAMGRDGIFDGFVNFSFFHSDEGRGEYFPEL